MKYLSLIGLFLVFQHIALAQVGYPIKPEDAQLIMKRKLLVITPDPDPKVLAKLRKKGENLKATEIEKLYIQFNESLREAIGKRWNIHKEAIYKTTTEFWQMDKKELSDYIVMAFFTQTPDERKEYFDLDPLKKEPGKKPQKVNDFYSQFPMIAFVMGEKFSVPIGKTVYNRKMPEACPGALSIFFSLQLINDHILESSELEKKQSPKDEKMALKANAYMLKEKVIYVGEDWKDEALSAKNLKTMVPYSIVVLNQAALLDKIRSNDAEAVVHFVWPEVAIKSAGSVSLLTGSSATSAQSTTTYRHLIVDIQTGKILAVSREMRDQLLTETVLKELFE